MTSTRILGCLLLIMAPLYARDHTDVIVMANGDRLTGEIKGLNAGVLRFDVAYVDGVLSVDWRKVARVQTTQLFIVETQDGLTYTGTIATPADQIHKIEVVEGPETKAVLAQPDIVGLEETSKSFLKRISGQISIGATFAKGNNTTQYNLAGDVEYRRARWGLQTDVSSNLSASTGAQTATRNQVTISGFRMLPWRNYYYGGLADFMQSSVQGISLQSTVGGGIGRYLKNSSRARISLLGGAAWQNAKYAHADLSIATQQVAAGLVALNAKMFFFKKTNLSLMFYVVPALNYGGRVHYSTNTSYYWKIFGDLSWNVSFYGNWDTQPPAHLPASDYGYTTGLKWTFGYR